MRQPTSTAFPSTETARKSAARAAVSRANPNPGTRNPEPGTHGNLVALLAPNKSLKLTNCYFLCRWNMCQSEGDFSYIIGLTGSPVLFFGVVSLYLTFMWARSLLPSESSGVT